MDSPVELQKGVLGLWSKNQTFIGKSIATESHYRASKNPIETVLVRVPVFHEAKTGLEIYFE